MKTLRQLLEAKKGSACWEIFQKEVFGWKTGEKDTNKEGKISDDTIMDWIENNEQDSNVVRSIKQLMKCQKEYPQALNPKNGTLVYRGLDDRNSARKYVNMYEDKFTLKYKEFFIAPNVIYSPHNTLQSFTSDWKVANKFTSRWMGMIIETKVTNDFVFTPKFSNWMDDSIGMDKEAEILRVSNKPLKCNMWIHKDTWYQFQDQKKLQNNNNSWL